MSERKAVMSPSRKSRPRATSETHIAHRHSPGTASPANRSPPVEAPGIPIEVEGRAIGAIAAGRRGGEGDLAAIERPSSVRGRCRVKGKHRDPHARSLVRHIVELEAAGWHVVELRPSTIGDAPALWRVTIERYDESAFMTMTEADPEVALAELVRYAQADAT
jgi:hypothetical protein